MRKFLLFFISLLMMSNILKADVIINLPYIRNGIAISLEGIGSYEFSFTKYNSLNIWGGLGLGVDAASIINTIKNPTFGAEIALELRHYFKADLFENFNLGLYVGFAYLRNAYLYRGHFLANDNSVGFVPGLKLTYKKRINSWIVGEPYVGISTPWYDDDFGELFNWISHSDPGLMLTFGLRIGLNKIRIK
jgi:hypothetical protein